MLVSNTADKPVCELGPGVYGGSDSLRWRLTLGSVICVHAIVLFAFSKLCMEAIAPVQSRTVVIEFAPMAPMKPLPEPERNRDEAPHTAAQEKAAATPTKPVRANVETLSPRVQSPPQLSQVARAARQQPARPDLPTTVPRVAPAPSSNLPTTLPDNSPSIPPTPHTSRGAEIAAAAPQAAAANSSSTSTADAKNSEADSGADVGAWHGQLRDRLHRFKRYPPESLELGQEGTVHVRFKLNRNGKILMAKIERSSGSEFLDEEALALVKRIQPLPKPPGGVADHQLELVVPVDFSLN